MLRAGLLEVSGRPWAFPIVLVPKKDESLRLCVNYRKFNAMTRPDPFPKPRAEDLLDSLAGARYISMLDRAHGRGLTGEDGVRHTFWKIALLRDALWPCRRPATLQRLMNSMVGDLATHVAAYMDDVVIF